MDIRHQNIAVAKHCSLNVRNVSFLFLLHSFFGGYETGHVPIVTRSNMMKHADNLDYCSSCSIQGKSPGASLERLSVSHMMLFRVLALCNWTRIFWKRAWILKEQSNILVIRHDNVSINLISVHPEHSSGLSMWRWMCVCVLFFF